MKTKVFCSAYTGHLQKFPICMCCYTPGSLSSAIHSEFALSTILSWICITEKHAAIHNDVNPSLHTGCNGKNPTGNTNPDQVKPSKSLHVP